MLPRSVTRSLLVIVVLCAGGAVVTAARDDHAFWDALAVLVYLTINGAWVFMLVDLRARRKRGEYVPSSVFYSLAVLVVAIAVRMVLALSHARQAGLGGALSVATWLIGLSAFMWFLNDVWRWHAMLRIAREQGAAPRQEPPAARERSNPLTPQEASASPALAEPGGMAEAEKRGDCTRVVLSCKCGKSFSVQGKRKAIAGKCFFSCPTCGSAVFGPLSLPEGQEQAASQAFFWHRTVLPIVTALAVVGLLLYWSMPRDGDTVLPARPPSRSPGVSIRSSSRPTPVPEPKPVVKVKAAIEPGRWAVDIYKLLYACATAGPGSISAEDAGERKGVSDWLGALGAQDRLRLRGHMHELNKWILYTLGDAHVAGFANSPLAVEEHTALIAAECERWMPAESYRQWARDADLAMRQAYERSKGLDMAQWAALGAGMELLSEDLGRRIDYITSDDEALRMKALVPTAEPSEGIPMTAPGRATSF